MFEDKPVKKAKKPILEYNNKTEQSYLENNLELPWRDLDKHEKRFLSKVDVKKGPIERKVTKIIRLKAIDYSSKRQEMKEYLVYYENWYGRDWMGRKLFVPDHLEGMYFEQETEPILKWDPDGRPEPEITGYKRSGQHPVHYIRFSKEAVDKIVENSVGSYKENIIFMIKINAVQRDGTFTYEQFVLSWEDIMKLELRPGGPRNPAPITLSNKPGIG